MIASTWEQHCAEYRPGPYSAGRYSCPPDQEIIDRDARALTRFLARALNRLDQTAFRRAA